MKLDRKTKQWLLVILLLALSAVIYSRPYSFTEIMPGINDAPVIKCEATYYAQEAGENGKPKYTTIYKEFDVTSDDYDQLVKMLESVTYRKQLAAALSGGKRTSGYSISHPYSIIRFYQDHAVYEYCLFNRYLPAGLRTEKLDYTPQGGKAFHAMAIEFVRTHGKTINEEIRQY